MGAIPATGAIGRKLTNYGKQRPLMIICDPQVDMEQLFWGDKACPLVSWLDDHRLDVMAISVIGEPFRVIDLANLPKSEIEECRKLFEKAVSATSLARGERLLDATGKT